MPTWTDVVVETRPHGKDSQRVSGKTITLTIPNAYFSLANGDRFEMSIQTTRSKKPYSLIMHGTVIHSEAEYTIVSCGGFLFRFPKTFQIYDSVFVHVKKQDMQEARLTRNAKRKL